MSFDYTMSADGSKAVAESRKVEQSLVDVEKAAVRVGRTITDSVRIRDGGMLSTQLAGLNRGLGQVSLGFEQLGKAIAAEEAMLNRIRGPSRDYNAQLQVLDSMLQKNRISTAEYANEVTRLNRELERGSHMPPPKSSGGTPGGDGHGGGSMLGSLAGGASHALLAAGAATFGAHELYELSNAYEEVANRIRVVSGSTGQFNDLMGATSSIAQNTRNSWEQTASTFQRLTAVTHELGLGQTEVLRLTQEMAMGAKISGASQQEAAMAMGEFAHAFELGTMQGREFKVLMRDVPQLMTELRIASGKTSEEFARMGKHGEITAGMLVTWFDRADSSIKEKFGKTVPTLSEHMAMFKDQLTSVVGKLAESLGAFEKFGSTLNDIAKAAGYVSSTIGAVSKVQSAGKDALGPVGTVIDYATNPFKSSVAAIDAVDSGLSRLAKSFMSEAEASKAAARAQISWLEVASKRNVLETQNHQIAELQASMERLGMTYQNGAKMMSEPGANFFAEQSAFQSVFLGKSLEDPFDKARTAASSLLTKIEQIHEQHALDEQAEQAKKLHDEMYKVNDEYDKLFSGPRAELTKLNELRDAVTKWQKFRAQFNVDVSLPFVGSVMTVNTLDKDRTGAVRAAELANAEQYQEALVNEGKTVADTKKKTMDHVFALNEVTEAYKAGKITAAEYSRELKALGVEESSLSKMLTAIKAPQKEFDQGMKDVNVLFGLNKITLAEYNAEVDKLMKSYGGGFHEILDAAAGIGKNGKRDQFFLKPREGTSFDEFLNPEATRVTTFAEDAEREKKASEERVEGAMREMEIERELQKERADGLNAHGHTVDMDIKQMDARNARTREQILMTREWRNELELLQGGALEKMKQGTIGGINQIKQQIFDISHGTTEFLTSSFGTINDGIVNAAKNSQDAWTNMFKSLEDAALKFALQLAELGLLKAIGLGTTGGLIGAIVGNGTTDSFSAGFSHEPINAGSHADGGLFRVNGSSGVDSVSVLMRVSPGEHLGIWPRGQAPSMGGDGGGYKVINVFDPKEIVEASNSHAGDRVFANFVRRYGGGATWKTR